jgi:hypothetical protein
VVYRRSCGSNAPPDGLSELLYCWKQGGYPIGVLCAQATVPKVFMHISLLAAGLLGIWFGYRLFCNMSRGSLSSVSGAVLAMAGIFVLVSEARAFAGHRTTAVTSVQASSNWHNGASHSKRGRTHLTNII